MNPNTVRRVLLGIGPGKVVPPSATSIFFGIYSHGEKHPTVDGIESDDPFKNEWFAHLPHPADDDEMYEYVATSGAKGYGRNHPRYYLYGSQIRAVLAHLFAVKPDRPVIGLLNYCLSGGNLHFMKNRAARQAYGADEWPLLLMSSAKATQEALVAGMWSTWFHHLSQVIATGGKSTVTFQELYDNAQEEYYKENVYELMNLVKSLRTVEHTYQNIFHVELQHALTAGPGGRPDLDMIETLESNYRQGKRLLTSTCDFVHFDPTPADAKQAPPSWNYVLKAVGAMRGLQPAAPLFA